MSVQTEIDRLNSAKDALRAAIEAKGVTVPVNASIATYAEYIGIIESLSAADKAKLIPENIREGVPLFEGTPREVVGTYAMSVKEEKTAVFTWNGTQKQSVTATYTVKKPCTVIAMSVIDFAAGHVTEAGGYVRLNGSAPTGRLTAGWYLNCSVYMFTASQGDVIEVYSTAKTTTSQGGVSAIIMTDE